MLTRRTCYGLFFVVSVGGIMAGMLFVTEFLPARWGVFVEIVAVLFSLNAVGAACCVRVWRRLSLHEQFAFTIWICVSFWYWSVGPLFFWLTIYVNDAQFVWAVFSFLAGTPLLAWLFVSMCILFFAPISYVLQRGSTASAEEIRAAYNRTYTFPIFAAALMVLLSVAWYMIGSFLGRTFAYAPSIEQVKGVCNGLALAPLLSIILYVLLDLQCNAVRLKLNPHANGVPIRHYQLFIRTSLLTLAIAFGSAALITVFYFQAAQRVAERIVLLQVRTLAERMFFDLTRERLLQNLLGNQVVIEDRFRRTFQMGEHTFTTTLQRDEIIDPSFLSPQIQVLLRQHMFGVAHDSASAHKFVVYLTDPATRTTNISIMFLRDFFSGTSDILVLFGISFCLMALVTVIASASVSFGTTRALRKLAKDAPDIMAYGKKHTIATGDEVEEVANVFYKVAKEAQYLRNNLEDIVARRTQEVSSKTEELAIKNRTLEELHAKDSALLESIGAGVIAVDLNGSVLFANKQVMTLLGYAYDEIIGAQWAEEIPLVTDAFGVKISLEKLAYMETLRLHRRTAESYYYSKKDGTRLPVSVIANPIVLKQQVIGAIIIFRDTTQEREIDRAKTEFVSLASHQLRTPISVISWYGETLLTGGAGALPPKATAHIRHMYEASRRMNDLIRTLLAITRIELGTVVIRTDESVYMNELTETIVHDLSQLITRKHLHVREWYESDLPAVHMTIGLLQIVVENIIHNAVKYTPEGGHINISLKSLRARGRQVVRLTVVDSGIGIPKSEIDQIFTKNYRASNIVTIGSNDTDGMGIGLYIARLIMDRMSGTIRVDSKEGKGSVFRVDFPAV